MLGPDDLIAGRYRLVRRLAAGGMGTVWEGWDERLHRPIAIKQLHGQQGLSDSDAEAAKNRAMREARITARLHHAHAVPVYDVVDHDGQPCLIMQYLPSTSLAQLVNDKGVLPVAECARIGAEIASALAAAHGAGIVHRDVKPGNVLIAEDGTAKITDFGISHALDDITVTSVGMVSGTPAYIAPEVARGAESGYAADVFSLGSTLYLALEGTPPFGTGANPMATLHRVASGRPTPPTHSGAMTPVLAAMMASEPADRPPMIDVVHRLSALAAVDPRAASPSGFDEATTVFPSSPIARTTMLPAAGPTPSTPPALGTAKDRLQALSLSPPPPSSAPLSTPSPPPSSVPPSGPSERERHRGPLLPLLAAILVIGMGIVVAVVLLGRSGSGGTPAGQAGTSSQVASSRSNSGSAASSARSSAPSSAQSSKRSSASASRSTAAAGATATAGQLTQAITDYYRLLPGNTAQGWALLTGAYRSSHAQGRSSYNSFWASIRTVTATHPVGAPPGTVQATITYVYKSGRVVDERTTFGLVRDGGVLKIASSSVQSSTTR